jgi:membrane protein implicated in regulation of membrane protease activity
MPFEPWLFWLVLAIVMLVGEFITVGFFLITLAAGSILAMLVALIMPTVWIQVAVFLLSSVLFFFTLKPFMQKLFPVQNETRTTVNRVIGKKALVLIDIDNINGQGQVKVDGDIWSARSISGQLIPKNSVVVIRRVEGVKVIVEPHSV